MESIFVATFEVESEAYQAFTEIKNHLSTARYIVPRMVLIKKSGGRIIPCDGYDAKIFGDDTALGGLLGMFVGVLGGPLGVLLGGATGALIGNSMDVEDINKALTLIEKTSETFKEGEIGLIALVQEARAGEFAGELAKFKAKINQRDAAEVAIEISEAIALEEKLVEEAKARLRQEKIDNVKQKLEEKRAELQKEFKAIRDEFDAHKK